MTLEDKLFEIIGELSSGLTLDYNTREKLIKYGIEIAKELGFKVIEEEDEE